MRTNDDFDKFQRIYELVARSLRGQISAGESDALERLVADDREARQLYLQIIEESLALRTWASGPESAGDGAVQRAASDRLAPSVGNGVEAQPLGGAPSKQAEARTPTSRLRAAREAFWHPIALLLLVGIVSAAILAYKFSTRNPQPVAQRQAVSAAVANVVSTTDAHWAVQFSPGGGTLQLGQRLILNRGSAEIVFGKQARVIFEAPAEFVITDATACRLDGGKLTAHVPEPARGFKVHTPDGTVTDLGTEFGVYVTSEVRSEKTDVEEQQQGGQPQEAVQLPPITEVHVFKGQVDITTEQLSTAPESKSENRKSKIVSAGEAVTISENKIEPLPAADPFKFAIDKLQGRPRTVLLSEDFESYDVGANQNSLGPWIFQGSTRKGQGIKINDVAKDIADYRALGIISLPSFNPPPPSISRVLRFVPSAPNPPSSFPCLAHTITAPQLARTCRLLVEFVIYPSHGSLEPSFALATEAGPAPGIEFWRNADPAAPRTAWTPDRCYRVRVLMDVLDGKPREARVERALWSGPEGWVRDADYRTPVPQVDWTTPPKFVIFGYPTVTPETPTGLYGIDSIRMEVISEK